MAPRRSRGVAFNQAAREVMPAKKMTAKIPTDAEIDRANLDEIQKITWAVVRHVLSETITTKEANAISRRVGKRIKAIEQELREP
jgi:hypothetical protein